jgi:N6-adenosine-specific RNA methylase IME4
LDNLTWSHHAAVAASSYADTLLRAAAREKLSVAQLVEKARLLDRPQPTATPALPDGVFSTLVADPPWAYERDHLAHRAAAADQYNVMPLDEIIALPVAGMAAEAAHLYVWTTNAFMVEAHAVARAWGFEQKTILTWTKPSIGLGDYYRNSTEHLLFCTRGSLPVRRHDVPTHFEAPRGRHSEKPARLYEIVESMSPGPYVELFARKPRAGWTCWGNELDAVAAGEAAG